MKAVEVIMEHEVPEDRIIFINLVRALSLYLRSIFRHDRFGRAQVSAPEGLKTFTSRYPLVKVVGPFLLSWYHWVMFFFQITGWIDDGLNERAYIIPGLGDFGERRYAHVCYGHQRFAHTFQVLCMICHLGVLFASPTLPGLQWTMKIHFTITTRFASPSQ